MYQLAIIIVSSHICTVHIGKILYSARLYRSVDAAAEVSAVFCMCPYQSVYTKVGALCIIIFYSVNFHLT